MTLDNLNKSGNEFVVNFSVHISGKQAWYNLSMFLLKVPLVMLNSYINYALWYSSDKVKTVKF